MFICLILFAQSTVNKEYELDGKVSRTWKKTIKLCVT